MPDEKAPSLGAFLPSSLMHHLSGEPMHDLSGVDMLLDVLEVPQCRRRAGTYRKLSKLMVELGWTPVRVRARTRGDYLEQVRGYCRNARCHSTVPNREIAPVGSSAPV